MAKISFGDSRQVKNFDLTSHTSIVKDGGTITGSPTFSRRGINLDGSADYVSYAIPNNLLSSEKISFVVEFTPDRVADEGSNAYFYSSSSSTNYYVYRFADGVNSILAIGLGDAYIGAAVLVDYSPHWKQNERNVLVVSGESGNTKVYLNGALILNSNVIWGALNPIGFKAGASISGDNKFDGDIHSIDIYNDLLTGDDAQSLYDNSLFNFKNKADVWLDMKSQVGKAFDFNETTLLTDGDMEAGGVGDWGVSQNPLLTKETGTRTGGSGTQILKVAYIDTGSPTARQAIISVGKNYRVTGWAKGDGSVAPQVLDSGATINWTGTSSTSWQKFDIVSAAGGTSLLLRSLAVGVGEFCEFDDVSIVETKELLSDGDMEATGVDEWTSVTSTLTKEAGTRTGGSGTQVLRITYNGTPNPIARQTVLTTGKRYRFTGYARGDGTHSPRVAQGTGVAIWDGTTSTDWQHYDVTVTATAISHLYYSIGSVSGHSEFDDVSVKEVLQGTEDKSGKGNDFLLGDGSDTTTFPAFSNPGFDFDGSSDYMNTVGTGIYNNTFQTITMCFKPDFEAGDGSNHYLCDSSTGSRYLIFKNSSNVLQIFLGNGDIAGVALATYEPYWNTHGTNVIVVSGTTGNTDAWLNGFKILDADNTAWTPADPAVIYLGANFSVASFFDGEFFHFSTYGKNFAQKMTPIQVKTITNDLFRRYSK